MKLRRIAIRHFRKLIDPLLIEDIGDGLTVLAGDNEEGKSTILAALKAALFENAGLTGEARKSFDPHGHEGTPSVELDFEQAGERYRLTKTFRRHGALLQGPHGRLDGDQAEARLRALLRFERPVRGASRPEHHGLQAVFWVDQATSFDMTATGERLGLGGERFKGAIEREIGGLAIGARGRQVLEHARERRDSFFAQNGKPRGEYAKLLETAATLTGQVAELEQKLALFDERRRDLLARREERRRFIERDEIGHARARLGRAQQQHEAAQRVRRDHVLATLAAKSARSIHAQAEAGVVNRAQLRQTLRAQREAIAAGEQDAAIAKTTLRQMEAGVLAAEHVAKAAASRERVELRRMERQRIRTAMAEARQEHDRLTVALTDLEADERLAREHRVALAQLRVDAPLVERLRQLDATARAARMALEATATEIRFEPSGPQIVRAAEGVVPAGEPVRVTAERSFELEGFGRLTVMPGGNLASRRQAADQAQLVLDQALQAAGVFSVAAAVAALERRELVQRGLDEASLRLRTRLQTLGETSLDGLRERQERLKLQLVEMAAQLDDGADDGTDDVADAPAPDQAALRREVEVATNTLRQADARLGEAKAGLARTEAALDTIRRDCAILDHKLMTEAATCDDAALAAAAETAARAAEEADAALAAMEKRLMQEDPLAAEEALQVALRTLRDLEAERQRLDRRVDELENQLRGAGDAALGEELAERQGQLDLARTRIATTSLEANAWRLLATELEAAAQELEERLIEPVAVRLRPYLRRLFDDAELVLDPETLAPRSLRRGKLQEAVDTLSVGTREQIAILIRLALGRLLKDQEGEAPCLILDDALVYADEGRFEVMKAALQRAAQDQQIIVLTCRPRDYLGLNGALIRLEECRQRES